MEYGSGEIRVNGSGRARNPGHTYGEIRQVHGFILYLVKGRNRYSTISKGLNFVSFKTSEVHNLWQLDCAVNLVIFI